MDVDVPPNLRRIDAAWRSAAPRQGAESEAEVSEVQVEPALADAEVVLVRRLTHIADLDSFGAL